MRAQCEYGPAQGDTTVPQVPSDWHRRDGEPPKVSWHWVDVMFWGVAAAAVSGQDA